MVESKQAKHKKKPVPVRKVLRLSSAEMLKRKVEIAIKNGTLRKMCEGGYGAKYVQKNFCPGCQYKEICAMQKGAQVEK